MHAIWVSLSYKKGYTTIITRGTALWIELACSCSFVRTVPSINWAVTFNIWFQFFNPVVFRQSSFHIPVYGLTNLNTLELQW